MGHQPPDVPERPSLRRDITTPRPPGRILSFAARSARSLILITERPIVLAAHAVATALLVAAPACNGTTDDNACTALVIRTPAPVQRVPPAGVRVFFSVKACNGDPVPDLRQADLQVLADGRELRSEGAAAPVLTQEVGFSMYALLLLDLSDSIVATGSRDAMLDAASALVDALLSTHAVAVYVFAGPSHFAEVVPFTTDPTALDAALGPAGSLRVGPGLGTTDLYGSIVRALPPLVAQGPTDGLVSRSLIIFTDGTDEAMVSTSDAAYNAISEARANDAVTAFTVGLGGDVNRSELELFGVDGFHWAQNADDLMDAFAEIATRISELARSNYMLALCSPRVDGMRTLSILVSRDGRSGGIDVQYSADGFDMAGCVPAAIAEPCSLAECGTVGDVFCGTCDASASSYCDGSQQCVDDCEGIACGLSPTIHAGCGSCPGLSEYCTSGTCIDDCEGLACGTSPRLRVDCGSCSGLSEYCLSGACVDDCEYRECGTSPTVHVDCGWCATTEFCSEDGTCEIRATVGDPCDWDTDCGGIDGGYCYTTLPGGYCTRSCSASAACPREAECLAAVGLCAWRCSSAAECRTGYDCLSPSGSGATVCIPP